ncbi:MAG: hypothetical protein ABSF23_14315 [Terracidiphilus sp.]
MVVAAGLTLLEPLAAPGAMFPGLMERLVAPDVAQLSVLLEPCVTLVGFALNELITGRLGCVTVTATVAVAEPAVLVAVNVYVVAAVGLTVVEPVAEVEEKLPGVIVTPPAPDVAQLKVVLEPGTIEAGFAVKDVMVGAGACVAVETDPEQPVIPAHASRKPASKAKAATNRPIPNALRWSRLSPFEHCTFVPSMLNLSAARCRNGLKRLAPGKSSAVRNKSTRTRENARQE